MVKCCGCSLGTGSMIIAIGHMVVSTIVVVISAVVMEPKSSDRDAENMLIILLCGGVVSLLFASLLLTGVVKRIPLMLMSWVIYQSVCLIVDLVGFFLIIGYVSLLTVLFQVSKTKFFLYCILVVHGHYKELVAEQDPATHCVSGEYGSGERKLQPEGQLTKMV